MQFVVKLLVLFILQGMLKALEHEGKTSDSIVIYANSSKRSSGITPSFTITLSRPITQIKSFEILGVEVPYSFYNVWKGNVGMGTITDTGESLTFNQGNLAASDTVTESSTFLTGVSSVSQLTIKIDDHTYIIPFLVEPNIFLPRPLYNEINYSINQVLQCTTAVVNYKLVFTITTTSNFSKIGFYLAGTTMQLASYMGLTETVEIINFIPTNTATVTMPTPYKIFNPTDFDRFTDYIYSYGTVGGKAMNVQATRQSGLYSSYALRYTSGFELVDYGGSIYIDPNIHYISYLLGFTTAGNYTNLQRPPNKLITPLKPPIYYDNRINVFADNDFYSISVPDGYYTPATLASYITTAFAAIPELATSTATASSAGFITLVINTANPHSAIKLFMQRFYGWKYLIFRMGFEEQFIYISGNYFITVSGTNITTATFRGSKPFDYKPTHLYVRSETLAKLTSDSVTFIDDPTYQLDSLIHKLGINASPNETIIDDQKYQVKRYVSRPLKTPLTQIDFSLYDEDAQLVQLNGRSWAIGIKIEF